MATQRVGGIISFAVNGQRQRAKGSFTWNAGGPMRETVAGADAIHGYTEKPTAPFIEGAITIAADTDVAAIKAVTEATVSLELGNGQLFVLSNAWFAGEGSVTTEQGEMAVRFEGITGELVR